MALVRLLPRARGQGEHRPKHSGFPLCKLCPNISFVSSTISGRVEGQDLNPCNLPMKPSLIHMHASLGWESPVCLTPSNKTVMGWLSYATQVELPGSCLVCGKTKDRQMLSLALPTLLLLCPLSSAACSTYNRVIQWGHYFSPTWHHLFF